MKLIDQLGNPIAEKDNIAFPLGPGQIALGTVVKIHQNTLSLADASARQQSPPPPPTIDLFLHVSLMAMPNGLIQGIMKVATPPGND